MQENTERMLIEALKEIVSELKIMNRELSEIKSSIKHSVDMENK